MGSGGINGVVLVRWNIAVLMFRRISRLSIVVKNSGTRVVGLSSCIRYRDKRKFSPISSVWITLSSW